MRISRNPVTKLDRGNNAFTRRKFIVSTSAAAILLLDVRGSSAAPVATEYHVAINGNDSDAGTRAAPFRTIQHAAEMAQAGNIITVHGGVYRECIHPPRGGTSDAKRITYQAAPGEKVVITGSEPIKGWRKVRNDTWKVVIPNGYFGKFNPYADLIHGDWFGPNGRLHHTGCIYVNGEWLMEAAHFEEVTRPAGKTPLWFATVGSGPEKTHAEVVAGPQKPLVKVGKNDTVIYAQFPGVNPNEAEVEMNVRKTVFTPTKVGINYLTVRGFDMRNAATQWAPPTAGQFGIISAYWCKGWIIENNKISYSRCCGIALGKYSDEYDNTSANTADGYVDTIIRALAHGWNKATVGSHIVRNNEVSNCGQTGVVGSMGCAFSTVIGNEIHDIHVHQTFGGAEMAGIKFHGAIDGVISHNHIYRCGQVSGIWLDWMGQGAQVTGNLMHDNVLDIFLEMQHGPILVANNLLLSGQSVNMDSQGIAYAQNLIAGAIGIYRGDHRITPFEKCHSTAIAGMYPAAQGDSGDDRFYNNLFVAPCNPKTLDNCVLPCFAAGNVFLHGAQPAKFDAHALVKAKFDPDIKLMEKSDGWYLTIAEDRPWRVAVKRQLVTTELLGKAKVSHCAYENPDGSRIRISIDFLGRQRDKINPFPGPFEISTSGTHTFKVWPIRTPAGLTQ